MSPSAEIDVAECPDCGESGHYDRRVLIGGRGVYTCPNGHRWQDADETPSEKGYTPVSCYQDDQGNWRQGDVTPPEGGDRG